MSAVDGAALPRFSLNQATTRGWPLRGLVEGCAAAGVPGVGLWREPVAEVGVRETARLVRDAGLAVTSLCRGGFFTAVDPDERARAYDDNRRAVDEAAALGAEVLVLVSGGLPPGGRDIDRSRAMVADAVAELAPYAVERGVKLAIEPLHPMFCSDRCVVATLRQALDLAAPFPPGQVGVVVDAYHVWWDPELYTQIGRAGAAGRIHAFQVCDWVTPLPADALTGRGIMGDGCIELRRMREAVDAAGYAGPIEVEIFNDELWRRPGDEVLSLAIRRYLEHVV